MTDPDARTDDEPTEDSHREGKHGPSPADVVPEGSPLRAGIAAHTVDPATGESHTGQ